MKRITNVFLVTLTVLFLSACGGGGGSLTYDLVYTAGANGTLSGTTSQTVNKDADGTAVTATANIGYHFTTWSDGSIQNPRIDTNIQANLNVTANFEVDPSKRIFTIGASTVHAGWWHSLAVNPVDVYGHNRVLEGWGEELDKYMKDPSKVYNRARSGSQSVLYRTPEANPQYANLPGIVNRHWGNTEELIHQTNDNNGGFLLIQFGGTESQIGQKHIEFSRFEEELKAYIQDARDLNLTPVLVSPPGARSHESNTRPYANGIGDIAKDMGVLFIDLYEKSKAVWQTYDLVGGDLPMADIKFSYKERHRGINNTHFGRNGAKIVAGWVRELACDPTQHNDRSQAVQNVAVDLCSQFVQGELEHNITMREDAEDGDKNNWETYDVMVGATITNIYDADKRSNVIVLQGDDGLGNGFRYDRLNSWEEENELVVSWEMNYAEDFTFFVAVDTEDGYKIFEYKPTDSAGEITSDGQYRFGLGADANDGTWHTFTRDIQADLKSLDPTKHILKIHRIAIRGSGRVDNIRTMRSIDDVSRDIAPTVATIGLMDITVDKGSVYNDAGVTVVDDNDADIMTKLETIGLDAVDTSTVGTYVIDYKVHDSVGNGGYATRIVHVIEPVDSNADVVIMHEDAEDGDTIHWGKYGNIESTIDNILDEDSGSHVIDLQGNDELNNGFKFSEHINITSGFVVSWKLKYTNDFRFFVQLHTVERGDNILYMEYKPDAISTGLSANGNFVHHGLGTSANDGTWHTFTRDIEADLKVIFPNDSITSIVGFSIRGSGRIDDISTSTRAPKETFAYNGNTYKIVKTASTWESASNAAHADGGYLANIGSIAENHEIYSRLYRYIDAGEYESTKAINGGEASYVWIGANDAATEGTWVWENNTQPFWSGIRDGNALNGLYSNWGRRTNGTQMEPDNSGNVQDAAAIAITEWQLGVGNLGQASQWNDLNGASMLYYIVEYE